ncbi:MAG: glycerophosphodiester phosphodiesterase family protein, partial [Kineosporiaceae bacterium]
PDYSGNRPAAFAVDSGSSGVVEGMHAPESPAAARPATPLSTPVVVGHRGAPSYRPEHTAAGYELAIDLGAQMIEPDVVVTRDGALIVRHESELSRSTDIAERPEFAERRTIKVLGDHEVDGWFAEDLTLAEIRTLRATERIPELRPLNTTYDGRFGIMTLGEVVELARERSVPGREIRVLAELKHPTWSAEHGLPMAELVAAELRRLGATSPDGTVVLQSFDAAALRELRNDLGDDGPTMLQLVDESTDFDAMTTPVGLREISTYAQGIAPSRHRLLLRDADHGLVGASDLVPRAHDAGLVVMTWTLRSENAFLPLELRRGVDPTAAGDAVAEARMLLHLGVDGLITDSPEVAVRARREQLTAA